jgi:hypothetical protein
MAMRKIDQGGGGGGEWTNTFAIDILVGENEVDGLYEQGVDGAVP